jgi:RNA polymerase sigma factor (sigma-70 family)
MSEPSDDSLLDAWCAGDKGAGNTLLSRHFTALWRFFENKVGADADDLIQRTLLACAESHTRIRRESSFRTYLFSIARHELYRFFRQKSSAAERLDFGVTSLSDMRTSATARLARAQDKQALESALARLPLDDQILLELAYTEELDSPALAEILGIEPSSVRSRLHRARKQLEQSLEGQV